MKRKTKTSYNKKGSTKQKIRGWLTRQDVELLEEASKRVLKYPKNPAKKYGCDECSYTWLYSTSRCPVCSSSRTKMVD